MKKKCFLKLVIIGDSGVGKTSLIQQYCKGKFIQQFKPTIGADFCNKELVFEDQVVTAQIWDTAGQERFQSLGYAFYRGADCCVLVFDITDQKSFENLDKWKSSFVLHGQPKDPSSFPFILFGNKADLTEERKVDGSKALAWSKQYDIPYVETSAKSNLNVEEAFQKIVELGIKNDENGR